MEIEMKHARESTRFHPKQVPNAPVSTLILCMAGNPRADW